MIEVLAGYAATGEFNDDHAPRPFLHGAYDVETFVSNGDTLAPLLTDTARFRRIFIHRGGYLVVQSMSDALRDYRLGHDAAGKRLILRREGDSAIVLDYALSGRDSLLSLRGVFGGDSIALSARRIDLEALPLLRDSFHWTIDSYR
jgi:hypothetical protein